MDVGAPYLTQEQGDQVEPDGVVSPLQARVRPVGLLVQYASSWS